MDHVGKYLVEAIRKIGNIQQPITIRLEGTNAETGRKTVEEAGFQCYETFDEAVKKIAHPKQPPKVTQEPQYKTPLNMANSPDGKEIYVAC